ncbi:hypothetical protein B0181_04075 [Moraxella caviae]|uniref:Uncharacterized conserved protein n=1 Tax=Moraxella caviae TaxID=34060 RepID=A0A1T0A566_9GAMM|nr:DUF302 domain-containing protein [Moraxella caviae]OOR90913.1 hypothetical protein B0181_04075 [Moraxella caviae]STZ10201.1 Uncharacterized conserved protein [Moraxella caviae]
MKLAFIAAAAVALTACAAPSVSHKLGTTKVAANPIQTQAKPAIQNAMTTQTFASRYDFATTVRTIQDTVQDKGMTVFAVIDHQAAAEKAGLAMQPASVIIFGAPKAGTPLMVKDPLFALQLPLKVLVTETNGQVTVAYTPAEQLIAGSSLEYADVENSLAKAANLLRAAVGKQ